MSDSTKIVLLVLFLIALVVFGPLITIWALNTLFPLLSIPYNLATWFAVVWLGGFVVHKGKK
jgi:hypothetical protein